MKNLFSTLIISLLMFVTFSSCSDKEDNYVIETKQMVVTVASKQPSSAPRTSVKCTIPYYFVKTEDYSAWQQFEYIKDFSFEPGYECMLRIKCETIKDPIRAGTSMETYNRYTLLEIISKEKKDSEGLPKW